MKYCPNCGKSGVESMKFCPQCGQDLAGFDLESKQAFAQEPQALSKKGRMRIAAGILTIVGGLIGGGLLVVILTELHVSRVLSSVPLIVAGIGGINALRRESYGWALAGAICSLLFPPFGIPAIILLVKRKGEFKQEKEYRDDSCSQGVAYYEGAEHSKAVADYNEAIELDPNDADAYYNRGCTYGEMGEYEKAIADFDRVVQLNPSDTGAYYNRGLAYKEKGDLHRAAIDLEKCIGLTTDPELTKDAQQTLLEIKNSSGANKGE